MKIKEYLIENKEKIAIGILGLAAVGGLIYWFTKKPNQQQPPVVIPEPLSQSKVSATSTAVNNPDESEPEDQSSKLMSRIVNEIRMLLKQNNHQITAQVVAAIIKGQYALSNEQVKSVIIRSRKLRRSKIDDHLEYAKMVTKHQLELEQLQERYLGVLLARFNIDKVSWKEANDEWQSQVQGQDQGISELIRELQEKQLLSLRGIDKKPIRIDQIFNVLQLKIDILQSLNVDDLGIGLGADEASRYELIETYISDLVFQKFKVQAEDLQYSIEQLETEGKKKVMEYEQKIANHMNELIEVEEDKQTEFL